MKRKRQSVAFLLVAFIPILMYFWRYLDSNPDFGNVRSVYRTENWVGIADCTGDTELLRATRYLFSEHGGVYVQFEGDRDFLLTTNHYKDGKIVDRGGKSVDYGKVEKLIDGAWVFLGDIEMYLHMFGGESFSEPAPKIGVFLCDEELLNNGRQVMLPELECGAKYRITHYFKPCEYDVSMMSTREIANSGTPEQLYSITHTVEIPVASSKRFDLVDLGLRFSASDGGSGSGQVMPILRVNYGKVPYWNAVDSRLDVQKDGKWDSVVQARTGSIHMPNVLGDADGIYELQKQGNGQYYKLQHLFFRVDDIALDYRLKLVFCEHPDGTGEQYTLTLNLRFDE